MAPAAPACSRRGAAVGAGAPPAPAAASDAGVAAAGAPGPAFADLEPETSDGRPDAGTVRIKLVADPRRQAHVFWGRKDLGVAPLEIVRPRGSAPLDLTVLAPECLPLHTRAFTDRDDTLSLRLYSEHDAAGLPGYSSPSPSPAGGGKPRRQF
jgi:hypothetical protein